MMKNSGKQSLLAIVALSLLVSHIDAQISQESFEGETGYTISNPFDDGSFDFFDRYMVPDDSNAARDDFQEGWHLDFGLMGQDFDAEGGDPTQIVSIDPVDTTGFTDLMLTVSLGGLDDEVKGGFDNYEAADGDGIKIFVASGGSEGMTQIGQFSPPAVGANSGEAAGDLYRDDDFDGVGDGDRLTRVLTDFSFGIDEVGATDLQIIFELTSTDSFEMIAMDNVRLTGVPEPASGLLCLVGFLAALGWRRK